MIRAIALTGSRRGEIINLKGLEVDLERSCFRLRDSKEGSSIRPIGLPTIELLDPLLPENEAAFVFPGTEDGKPLVGFAFYLMTTPLMVKCGSVPEARAGLVSCASLIQLCTLQR